MTSEARLALIDVVRPTVICCTPTYALRLVEVARQVRGAGPPLADGSVRVLIVAGEPGGSIPATREQIERGWGGARHRPSRPDRGRTGQLRVLGQPRRRAPQRVRVHRRGARPGHGAARAGRRAGGAGPHEPGPHGQPPDPLPDRRPRGARRGPLRLRPDARPARRRHPLAHRRHGPRQRRERLPDGHRGRAAGRRRGGRVPGDHRPARRAAGGDGRGRARPVGRAARGGLPGAPSSGSGRHWA